MQPETVRVNKSEVVLILLEFQGFQGILAFGGGKDPTFITDFIFLFFMTN